jgi:hypothetical protein
VNNTHRLCQHPHSEQYCCCCDFADEQCPRAPVASQLLHKHLLLLLLRFVQASVG